MNRRAFFFTVTALFVVGILLLVVTAQRSASGIDRLPAQEVQIEQGANLIQLIEEGYVPRVIQTIGFVELNELLTNYATEVSDNTPQPTSPTEEVLQDALATALLEENTGVASYFQDLSEKVQEAQQFTLVFEQFDRDSVTIFQDETTGPWNLGVTLTLSYSVDASEAHWDREDVVITALVPVEGLPEPLYANQGVILPLKRTAITGWGSVSILEAFIENNESRHREEAPSFLSRLNGDTTASECCGYESFIHSGSGITIDNTRSAVDWCMLSSTTNCPMTTSLVFINPQCSTTSTSSLSGVKAASETFTRRYLIADTLLASTCTS